MANVCFAPPTGSKLTRTGLRCHDGAGQAESGGGIVGHATIGERLLQHRLAAADLSDHGKSFLPVVGDATIGDVIAIPTRGGIKNIELRKIDRSNVAGEAIDEQPAPRCHCQRGPGSSGRLSFTRNARRTTNSRSVTSCGEPRAYSLARPSTTSARILSVTGLSSAPGPANQGTAVHLLKVMTWTFAAAPAAFDSNTAQISQQAAQILTRMWRE